MIGNYLSCAALPSDRYRNTMSSVDGSLSEEHYSDEDYYYRYLNAEYNDEEDDYRFDVSDVEYNNSGDEDEDSRVFASPQRALFARLRRNHAKTIHVDCYILPTGYGYHLGNALVGNTVVQNISRLDIRKCFNYGRNAEASAHNGEDPLLRFFRESTTLQYVNLSGMGLLPPVTNQALLALAASPTLTTLKLELKLVPSDSFIFLMEHSKSLASLIGLGHGSKHPNSAEQNRRVAQAIANRTLLRKLSVSSNSDHVPLITEVLREMKSQCFLTELEIDGVRSSSLMEALASLLSSTTSIQRLTIKSVHLCAEWLSLFGEGLVANQSVSHLGLERFSYDTRNDGIHRFLRARQTPAWSPNLQSICFKNLDVSDSPFDGPTLGSEIVDFLRPNATRLLRRWMLRSRVVTTVRTQSTILAG
jgi:hypothetical protein